MSGLASKLTGATKDQINVKIVGGKSKQSQLNFPKQNSAQTPLSQSLSLPRTFSLRGCGNPDCCSIPASEFSLRFSDLCLSHLRVVCASGSKMKKPNQHQRHILDAISLLSPGVRFQVCVQ